LELGPVASPKEAHGLPKIAARQGAEAASSSLKVGESSEAAGPREVAANVRMISQAVLRRRVAGSTPDWKERAKHTVRRQ